jgi:hypothetical protein
MKHKSSFVGETIVLSICNKPFKSLGFPNGRVKSRVVLPKMIRTNIEVLYCQLRKKSPHKHMVHTS